MLVGSYTQNSDSNRAIKHLNWNSIDYNRRGLGVCGDCTSYDPTGICVSVDLSNCSGSDTGTGIYNPTTNYPNTSNPTPWTSIAAAISSIGSAAAKAFGATQVQCSVGTTLVGNQCLPTTAVNALVAQSAASAINPLGTFGSLSSMLPLLLIGGVVLLAAKR